MQCNKDRAYLIEIDGKSREIRLAARVIDGLLLLNQSNRREDVSRDKSFIKALLISICSLKTIQNLEENERLNKSMLAFIKGKYIS